MITLLDIREKLQDTHATMARLRQALSSTPTDDGIALMAESLLRRQEYLEGAFRQAADTQHLDICN